MNPWDTLELQDFQKKMDLTMPYISDINARIPWNYGQLPKNFIDPFNHSYDRFLNSNAHTLYEMAHRKNLTKSYVEGWIRNHGGEPMIRGSSLPYAGMVLGMGSNATQKVKGATIETVTSTNSSNDGEGGFLALVILGSAATVGQVYDQNAVSVATQAGNMHLGTYDDNGSPHNLLADTGDITCDTANSYTPKSVTEYSVTTSTLWCACTFSNSSSRVNYLSGQTSGNYKDKSFTYAALPNPAGSGYSNGTLGIRMKISHS